MTNQFLKNPADLSELQYAKPDDVEAFVTRVNALDPDDARKMVIAIGTGGTISMVIEEGIRIPGLKANDVLEFSDAMTRTHFSIESLNVLSMDSSQMHYGHSRELAIVMSYLWRNIKTPFLGFMVIHGTDTMSYSASAMSLILGPGLPFSVVYTGSQKSIVEPLSDAVANIRNALYTLEALHENNMAEVVIAMGQRAVLATSSEKVDDARVNAFDAPLHQYVAQFEYLDYPVRLASWLRPRREADFTPTIWDGDYSHTLVVKSSMGLDPEEVKSWVLSPRIKAVILYSYGAGTVYDGILDALQPAIDANMPVFVVNPVFSDYKVNYESAKALIAKGAVPLLMTLSSALAKLEIARRKFGDDKAALTAFMTDNYVGEVPTEASRLAARG